MKQQPEQKAAAQLKSVTSSPTRPANRGVTETHSGRRRGTSSPTRRPQQDSESTLTPVSFKGAPVNEHSTRRICSCRRTREPTDQKAGHATAADIPANCTPQTPTPPYGFCTDERKKRHQAQKSPPPTWPPTGNRKPRAATELPLCSSRRLIQGIISTSRRLNSV